MVLGIVVSSIILAAHLIQAPSTGDVRLDTNSKRLEIYYYGEWGTVCDDGFDDNDAKVVCRQLGYSNGISLGSAVDDGDGTILLESLQCTGSESKLIYCSHLGWKKHDCTHSEDVGVLCNNLSPVNGGWSSWVQWTTCTSSCGFGLQSRTRQCNNPSTQYGGSYCYGLSSQTRKCNTIPCPVIHGGWSTWTNWTGCTRVCNGGLMERARNCDSPPPINGGLYCNGTSTEADLCNTVSCSGIETKMVLALLVGGVGVGCILITVALVLLCIHVAGSTRKQKKEVAESRFTEETKELFIYQESDLQTKSKTVFREDTEELYIYQESDQPAQVNTTFKEDTEELYIYQESDQPIKANTGFKGETEELYIYQESDQPTQSFNNSAYIQDLNSKDVAKTGEDVDPCDIYENYEENCYENF